MSYLRLGFLKGFARKGRLLDIGYGNGSFIKLSIMAGYDSFGKEVHGLSGKYGIRESGLDESWDIITLFDSLEHMDSLDQIRNINSKLIIVSTPLRPTTFPSNLGWKHWKPGEHLHYFDRNGIEKIWPRKKILMEADVEDVIRTSDNGQQNILTIVLSD
jgi:hypothetical protein